MPDISIASPEFTRAWQFLQDHLLHEIEAAEPEGREALDIINAAIERAQARTAEDERRDAVAALTFYKEKMQRDASAHPDGSSVHMAFSVAESALLAALTTIERGDHVGAADRKETP